MSTRLPLPFAMRGREQLTAHADGIGIALSHGSFGSARTLKPTLSAELAHARDRCKGRAT